MDQTIKDAADAFAQAAFDLQTAKVIKAVQEGRVTPAEYLGKMLSALPENLETLMGMPIELIGTMLICWYDKVYTDPKYTAVREGIKDWQAEADARADADPFGTGKGREKLETALTQALDAMLETYTKVKVATNGATSNADDGHGSTHTSNEESPATVAQ